MSLLFLSLSFVDEYIDLAELAKCKYSVNYNHVTQTYRIEKDGFSAVLSSIANYALINGELSKIQTPVKIVEGKPLVLGSLFSGLDSTTLNTEQKTIHVAPPNRRFFKIVLDPGHGGKDPGTAPYKHIIIEKDLNLQIALLAYYMLKERGYQVFMTRQSDVFIPLEERTDFANRIRPDCFVSIHANYSKDKGINGFELWVKKGSGHADGYKVAQFIRSSMRVKLGVPDRGIKRKNYYVLRNSNSPSVLIELDFLSNRDVATKFLDHYYRREVAGAIVDGLENYLASQN